MSPPMWLMHPIPIIHRERAVICGSVIRPMIRLAATMQVAFTRRISLTGRAQRTAAQAIASNLKSMNCFASLLAAVFLLLQRVYRAVSC